MLLGFDDTAATLEVPECPLFLEAMRAAAPDWPFHPTASPASPAARIVKVGGGYLIRSPDGEDIEASAVGAACSAICDLATAFADERPDQLSLHCAAVLSAGRLVVMPSRSHAGKSTLATRLAAAGHTLFGDDMLLVDRDDRTGTAMGVAPRLRLPLPAGAGEVFGGFVARNGGARDARYLYLDLPGSLLARRGTRAEIGAILLLDRRRGMPARLHRAAHNAALQTLIRQNVTATGEAAALLARASALVARLPCYALVYDDLDEAAALFATSFSAWPPPVPPDLPLLPYRLDAEALAGMAREDGADGLPSLSRSFDKSTRLRRHAGVSITRSGTEAFLAGGAEQSILHLNEIGTGIWTLLAEPISEAEASDLLAAAFPDVDPATIEKDVASIFAALASAGMIEPR